MPPVQAAVAPSTPISVGGAEGARVVPTTQPATQEAPSTASQIAEDQGQADRMQAQAAQPLEDQFRTLAADTGQQRTGGEGSLVNGSAAPGGEAGQVVQESAAGTNIAESAAVSQPSEETIKQTLTAMGKGDTPANREIAKQLIVVKEQQEQANAEAAAQKTTDVVKGEEKKEQTLSPDDRAVMKTLTEMAIKETENFKKFFAALAKDDPEYAKELADNLKLYREIVRKEKDAGNRKLLMGLGVIAFIIWLTFNVATSDGGQR